MKMENWHLTTADCSPFTAPEARTMIIAGELDGQKTGINMDRIVGRVGHVLHSMGGKRIELGQPSAEYEKMFPGAKERILSNIAEIADPIADGQRDLIRLSDDDEVTFTHTCNACGGEGEIENTLGHSEETGPYGSLTIRCKGCGKEQKVMGD